MELQGKKEGLKLASKRSIFYFFFLFLLSCYLMFFRLGSSSLKGGEANHAVVSKHVADTGILYPLYMNSIDPRAKARYYCMKPPLKIWAEALAFHYLSYNEFAARVVDALLGVLTILLVYTMVLLIFESSTMAFLASMLTLAFPPIIISHCFRHGNQDSALVFFYTAAILFYMYYKKKESSLAFLLSVGSVMLGLLVKDVFLLFFVFSVVVGEVLIFKKSPRSLFSIKNIFFIAVPLVFYLSFKIYSGVATHGVCLSRFLKPPFILSLGEHKPRYIKGFFYYFNILFKFYGVFILLTLIAILKKYVFRSPLDDSGSVEHSDLNWKIALFVLFICLLYVFAISIPIYKVKRYIYPIIPGLAVSMSFFIWTLFKTDKNFRWKLPIILLLVVLVFLPLRYESSKIRKVKVNPYHVLMEHYNHLKGDKAFLVDLSRSEVFGTYDSFYFSRLSDPIKWYQEPKLLSFLRGFHGRAFVVVSEPGPFLELLKESRDALVKIWPLKHRKKQIPKNFVIELDIPQIEREKE